MPMNELEIHNNLLSLISLGRQQARYIDSAKTDEEKKQFMRLAGDEACARVWSTIFEMKNGGSQGTVQRDREESQFEEIVAALEWMLNASATEPGMDIYQAHQQRFRALIDKVSAQAQH